MAAQCLEHMIREYRTLFVARKRAIVPPALPTSRPGGTPPGGAAATPVAAAVGAAEAAVIVPLEAPSPNGSARLRINVRSWCWQTWSSHCFKSSLAVGPVKEQPRATAEVPYVCTDPSA